MCSVFQPKEFDFADSCLIYGLDQKLSSSTNVEILGLNLNKLKIINCIEILAVKSNSVAEISVDKILALLIKRRENIHFQ